MKLSARACDAHRQQLHLCRPRASSRLQSRGALLFGAGLAILALLYFSTKVSHVLLFCAAFILTRPLGATVGDLLDKATS